MTLKAPTIGSWYREIDSGQTFEIVAIDESGGNIEIQYLDGNLAEFDFDSWEQINLATAEPPEDAAAGYEITPEDQWGADINWAAANTSNPLAMMEPESFPGTDEF